MLFDVQPFWALFDESLDGVVAIDAVGCVVGCNASACRLLGRSRELLVGQPAANVLPASLCLDLQRSQESRQASTEPLRGKLDLFAEDGTARRVAYGIASRALPDLSLVTLREVGHAGANFPENCQQIEELLRQQTQREHVLRGITQRIRQSLSVETILSTAVEEVRRVLRVDRALIFRLISAEAGVVIQESVNPAYPLTLEMKLEDRCFGGSCRAFYQQHKTRLVPDVYQDAWAGCLADYMQQFRVKSKMVAAILQRRSLQSPDQTTNGGNAAEGVGDAGNVPEMPMLWGLLIVHSCETHRQWQTSEADLLQHIADQLAIALQQAELYHQVQQLNLSLEDKVQQRTAELKQSLDFEAMLRRISDRLRDSLDEHQILQTAVQELAEQLHLDSCEVGFFSNDSRIYTIAYEYPINLPPIQGTQFNCDEHYDVAACLYTRTYSHVCSRHPLTSWVGLFRCPVADEQGNLGILSLVCPAERVFTEQEIRLAEQVAIQCAIAIRQARLFQAAQAQVAELERLNQLKDDFLNTVSHELRTPLSNISMATQMLEITLRDMTNSVTEPLAVQLLRHAAPFVQILKEESLRETSLINDLLELARVDSETEPLLWTTVNLRDILPHIAEPFLQYVHNQQQHLELQVPNDLKPLTTDLSYLERILSELLHNACKYTPAGGEIQVRIEQDIENIEDIEDIKQAAEQTGGEAEAISVPRQLRICVTNTGVEIPAEERDRIFEKFYRIPNNDPWKYGGTGLGLALARKLAVLIGGQLSVKSASGQTTFVLALPLAGQPQDVITAIPASRDTHANA
ncbi:GAF domain-containing protein [Thermoleptolyngbya sp. M55_K2018_002]|uniref:sensor histidine kinase n=1 Tax=Thermoleptolyngbya sp. M55_K2018_002 TaxID=2747808 RepID=UPI001A08E535|nr:GAF domain-containing protein [Thermoleptolyngbya sp. M55_K2018_002]HIK42334.1 GAF domain-containing protein [Thermoleptolyngbya sp. M55_K2018_002]